VILEIDESTPSYIGPKAGMKRLHYLAQQGEIVVVLGVTAMKPLLVRREPHSARFTPVSAEQASWIRSVVQTRVERVVKNISALQIEAGRMFVFEDDGGTATISRTVVEAVVPWVKPLVPGRRYLVFGALDEDGRFLKGPTYEESGPNTLSRTTRRTPARPDLRADPVEDEPDDFEYWGLDFVAGLIDNELRK
jgi:hypothetical protein